MQYIHFTRVTWTKSRRPEPKCFSPTPLPCCSRKAIHMNPPWIHPESTHLPPQFLWKLLWTSLPLTIFEQWQGVVVWTSNPSATHKSKISQPDHYFIILDPGKFNEWIPMWMMALENVSSFQHVAILGIYLKFGGGVYSYNWGDTRGNPKLKHKSVLCFSFLEVQVEELHGDFEPPFEGSKWRVKDTHRKSLQTRTHFNPQNLHLQTFIFQLVWTIFFGWPNKKKPKETLKNPQQNWTHAQNTNGAGSQPPGFPNSLDPSLGPRWMDEPSKLGGFKCTFNRFLIGKNSWHQKKWMK